MSVVANCTLRACGWPGCGAVFDIAAHSSGEQDAGRWRGDRGLGLHICPAHGWVWDEGPGGHLPLRGYEACSCGAALIVEREDRTPGMVKDAYLAHLEDVASLADVADLVALPGDSALDCHVIGLRLSSVIALRTEGYDVEVTLVWDTSEIGGWWMEDGTGERVFPDRVSSMETAFGVRMETGHEHLAQELVELLTTWADSGAVVAMTCAPGKWTLLQSPGHPAGGRVVIPRGAADEESADP